MCLFSFSMSISPGPVNLITLSTGVNHGLGKAMPFVSGATIGFSLLLIATGLGLGRAAEQSPQLFNVLSYGGIGFLIYIGYRIAFSPSTLKIDAQARPSFLQGFLLQWLNPKAWVACLAGVSAFNLTDSHAMLAVFVSIYFLICYLSIASWALAGEKIGATVRQPQFLRFFNLVVGGVLILVALYLLSIQIDLNLYFQ